MFSGALVVTLIPPSSFRTLTDPTKIIAKIKYHLLAHLRADIIRFGPLIGEATETYECFNAIFRFCSILSNHQSPSRDIALQLAEQEVVKHFLSGGYWLATDGKWTQPGPSVCAYLGQHVFLQVLLGYGRPPTDHPAGTVTLLPLKRSKTGAKMPRPVVSLHDIPARDALNLGDTLCAFPANAWYRAKSVISLAGDECTPGSWVYARNTLSGGQDPPITGRIIEIVQEVDGSRNLVVLDVFQTLSERHDIFGTPILVRRHDEKVLQIISADTVLFEYNIQHDCQAAQCYASGTRRVQQERSESDTTEQFVEHKSLNRYLVNTYAFHNAHLLRCVLPRDLIAPIPFSTSRCDDHMKAAASLRASQITKKAEKAEKDKKKKADTAGKRKAVSDDLNEGVAASGKRPRQGEPEAPSTSRSSGRT